MWLEGNQIIHNQKQQNADTVIQRHPEQEVEILFLGFQMPIIPPLGVSDENNQTFKISNQHSNLWGIYFKYTNFRATKL